MVMPCTGDPRYYSGRMEGKIITKGMEVPERIPYKIRRELVTEMRGSTVDDQVPEVRDSHEASQDQAEEATEEKDA